MSTPLFIYPKKSTTRLFSRFSLSILVLAGILVNTIAGPLQAVHAQTSYTISGNVEVEGVTLSYSDDAGAHTASSDINGDYSFTVQDDDELGWSGTVTPSKTGYLFIPGSMTYSAITADETNQDYTAVLITFTISGNAGAGGVLLSWDEDGITRTFTTGGAGTYSIRVPYDWSGTITPTKSGYIFTLTEHSYSHVLAKQTNQNFYADIIPTDISLSPSNVGENLPAGTTVGALSTTDGDGGDTFTYSLVDGGSYPDNASFQISGANLQTNAVFDYETKSSYSIKVQTDDGHNGIFAKVLTVIVDNNSNETPTDISLSPSSVAENSPAGTTVGTLSTSDPNNPGDSFTYSLVSSAGCPGTDNGSFAIAGALLQTAASFNYEVKNSYVVCVRTTDSGTLTYDKPFTVTVNDVNEGPTDIGLSSSSVAEGNPAGTTVGTLSSTDVDSGDSFTYSLASSGGCPGTDNASFSISGSALKTAAVFDYETQNSYVICVRTTDSGTLTYDEPFTITVTDAGDAPTDINLSASSVDENLSSGTTVGTLSTIDPDSGDSFTYSLASSGGCPGTDNASFSITGSALKTAAVFDYEATSSYVICVRTTDSGTLTFDKPFTITVNDTNDPPTDISLTSSNVNENLPSGTTVGTLSSTDQNNPGDSFTYSLVSSGGCPGTDNSSFAIAGALLQTAASFNYEVKNSYVICVRTTDSASLTFDEQLTITVMDVNEAPTDISLSPSSVNENSSSGTTVGTLSSTDVDSGDSFTYSLASSGGCPGTDNASFAIAGALLQTAASFNYEVKNSYVVCVRTTDSGTLTYDKPFTVTVNDVNEGPTDIDLSASSIAENSPSGTTVGTLSSTDVDSGDSFTYSLASSGGCPGTDNASFAISGSALKTAAVFDYETQNSYAICVRTTDSGSLIFDEPFTITVTDANDAPTDIGLSASNVAENSASGTTVGTLSSTDVDSGDSFTYSLASSGGCPGTDNGSFAIAGALLQTAASFNYEVKNSYVICVRTSDSGSLTFDKPFTVTVTDVNEDPTDIGLSPSSVAENLSAGTTVGTLSSTDVDGGDTFTYSLVGSGPSCPGTDNASFSITGSALQTAAVFDYETQNSYVICVRTSDSGLLTFDKQFTVTVTDADDAPTDIGLSASNVDENIASGTTVGTLSSTDVDSGETFTYSLASSGGCPGTDNASFSITGSALKTAAVFDYETKSSYAICVRTTDSGALTFDKPFTITVNDTNDPPTDISLTSSNVNENLPSGTTVGTLSSTDQNNPGDSFTYLLVNTGSCPGTNNATFSITGAALKTVSTLNYEVKNSYVICVRTTDSTSLTFDKQFTITVNDLNESPTNVSLSPSSVLENQPSGTTVGTLGTTDPDSGDSHAYSLVDGGVSCPGTDNASFSISGTALQTAAVFDYATKNSYLICVRSSDSGSLTFEKEFTVTVTLPATDTPTPTETFTPTATSTATFTPTSSDTPTSTFTPSVTLTSTPTKTLTPTVTLTPSPTLTETQTPTVTLTATITSTATRTRTPTPTTPPGFSKIYPWHESTIPAASSVTFSWKAYAGAHEIYRYCYDTTANTTCDGPAGWTESYATSATVNGLSPNKTYYWQVQAITCAACSPKVVVNTNNGLWWSFTTSLPTPTPTPVSINISSSAAEDGWILESGENTGTGGTMNASTATFQLGDDAANRQYRAVLSFDTSTLPDNAVVSSAVLKIAQSGAPTGGNPFAILGKLWVDLRKGAFSNSAVLQLADFKAGVTSAKVASFTTTPVSGWYSATLNQAGRNALNRTGLTQLRLYFNLDDDNDHASDFIKFLSGNSASKKPVLVLKYSVP